MLLIICPHCGPRNRSEFAYRDELVVRPPADTDPAAWRSYLYERRNTAGWQRVQWFHVAGCRRYLVVERHTVTNEIRSVAPAEGRS